MIYKTLIAKAYGNHSVLQYKQSTLPKKISVDEILVKNKATTVNRTDTGILSGTPWFARMVFGLSKPKKEIRGSDFAGIIQDKGKNVTEFEIGDKIFGFYDEGILSHAEYLIVKKIMQFFPYQKT